MIQITCVRGDEAYKIWDKVNPFVMSALKKWIPIYESVDLLSLVEKGAMQLWITVDEEKKRLYGATLTQILPFPLCKVMHIYLTGGDNMDLWKYDLANKMEEFSRAEGCKIMQSFGRRGWMAFSDSFESGVVLHKILD